MEIHKEIPEQIRALFNLAIYTGLRKGEILALAFSDIDFEKDIISVTKAASVVNGHQVCKQPKTKKSVRTITIPHDLTLRILTLKKSREEFIANVGDFWQGEDWIFAQDNGQMMSCSTPYQSLQDALRCYNADKPPEEQLPMIPFHGLRHTAATLLIAAGVDVTTISARLGHVLTGSIKRIAPKGKQTLKWQLIPRNPAEKAELPSNAGHKVRYLDEPDAKRICIYSRMNRSSGGHSSFSTCSPACAARSCWDCAGRTLISTTELSALSKLQTMYPARASISTLQRLRIQTAI